VATSSGPDRPSLDRSPYVGLRAFHGSDEEIFFGRVTEAQELITRLSRHGIVAVVGPSGVGKSSLVRAGVLPALTRGAIPDSDTWTQVIMTPGSHPLKTLATALAATSDDLTDADVEALLAAGPDGLHDVAEALLRARMPTTKVLLVIDQLEEAFTLADRHEATRLVDLLTTASQRADSRVAAVVTLRGDFFDAAAHVGGMAHLLSHAQYVVPPLEGEQVEEAVVGPARRAGLTLEPGLLGRILTDMAGQDGALPLLAHLLRALWERRVGNALTRGAYTELGAVAGALGNRAEAVYADLDRPTARTLVGSCSDR
jgi:hypothetical protein